MGFDNQEHAREDTDDEQVRKVEALGDGEEGLSTARGRLRLCSHGALQHFPRNYNN